MNLLLRLGAACGLVATIILAMGAGTGSHDAELMGPVNLLLLLIGLAIYVLPAWLAFYRDCNATVWIVLVNLCLGWTIVGWFAALGWAASGSVRPAAPPMAPPTARPATGH